MPVALLKYTVYQPLYKHLTTERCNRPNRINHPREAHHQLCTSVSGDRWDFMVLYRRVTVLCTVKTFRSAYYSSQNNGHKTFKSSYNCPEDYVYHSIRDAALTGIAWSETPVPVSVCFVEREQHDHSNTCWRP